jgi:hypothetical protein
MSLKERPIYRPPSNVNQTNKKLTCSRSSQICRRELYIVEALATVDRMEMTLGRETVMANGD